MVSSGPRHLVLSATVNGERLCLTSAHFPHQGRPDIERTRLQEEIDSAWRQTASSLLLMGCDANGRILGTIASRGIDLSVSRILLALFCVS